MAELAAAGSAVGIISLGVQVCQGLISYYEVWKGRHKDIADTAESIATFSGILKTVLAVLDRQVDKIAPLNKQIDDVVSQCKKAIDTLSMELAKFEPCPQTPGWRTKTKSDLRRLHNPFWEGTLVGLRYTVQDARSNLISALEILQLNKSIDITMDTKDTMASLASQSDKLTILEKGNQDANASLASQQNKLIEFGQFTKNARTSLASQQKNLSNHEVATNDTNISLASIGNGMSPAAIINHVRWLIARIARSSSK